MPKIDFVYDIFGADGANRLIDVIASNDRSTIYLEMRNELAERFAQRFPRGIGLGTIINYLVWCSLQMTARKGEPLESGPSPVTLFEALIEHVLRTVRDLDLHHVTQAVGAFYREWDFSLPFAVAEEQRARVEDYARRFTEQLAQFLWASERPLSMAYRALTTAYDSITRLIASAPEQFFAQRSYVWSALAGVWPSIYVKARWDGNIHNHMTIGTPLIPFEQWDSIAIHAGMFQFLMRGPHHGSVGFFDDYCRQLLTEPPFAFRLVDRSGLFS
jgi:hypothetical protein